MHVLSYSTTSNCMRGRSAWKGPFIDSTLLNPNGDTYKNAKIMSRSSAIPMSMIGQNVFIHNGKEFKKVAITRERVGYKFGEFSLTRSQTTREKETKSKAPPSKKKKND